MPLRRYIFLGLFCLGAVAQAVTPTNTETETPVFSPTPSSTETPVSTFTVTLTPGTLPAPAATQSGDDPEKDSYVAPDPVVNGRCDLIYRMEGPGKAKVRIFQASGDQVGRASFEHPSRGIQRSALDLRGYAPGVYFYFLNKQYDDGTKEKLPLRKFIVTK